MAFKLAEGETLFSQGDHGNSVFFITGGSVAVLIGGIEVAQLGAGRYFGELGLMLNDRRSATIMAVEDSEIMELTRNDFFAVRAPALRRPRRRTHSRARTHGETPHFPPPSPPPALARASPSCRPRRPQVIQANPDLAHDMFEALPEASKARIRAQAAPPLEVRRKQPPSQRRERGARGVGKGMPAST